MSVSIISEIDLYSASFCFEASNGANSLWVTQVRSAFWIPSEWQLNPQPPITACSSLSRFDRRLFVSPGRTERVFRQAVETSPHAPYFASHACTPREHARLLGFTPGGLNSSWRGRKRRRGNIIIVGSESSALLLLTRSYDKRFFKRPPRGLERIEG